MAHKRRSERLGHYARRLRRGRGVVARVALSATALFLAALALAAAGCSDAVPTDPTPVTRPPVGQTGQAGGGGTGGDVAVPDALVGEWEALLVFSVPGDIVTTRTRWRFDADGTCRRTATTTSAVEGLPRVNARDCDFDVQPGEIVITFVGGEVARFDLSLLELPDTIVLDGLAYQRVG